MQDLLEGVQLLALVLDTEGNVTFCNDQVLLVTGLTKEELMGANWLARMVPEREQDKWRTAFESTLSGGNGPFRMGVPLLTKAGARLLISWDCILLRCPCGEVTGTARISPKSESMKRSSIKTRKWSASDALQEESPMISTI
jgi:PAS domain S-box-containing protein